jgi:hypothetical protein
LDPSTVEAALNPLNTFGSVKRWFGRTFAEAGTLRRGFGHWESIGKKKDVPIYRGRFMGLYVLIYNVNS